MNNNPADKKLYFPAAFGAALMMLLRLLDKATVVSVLLVVAGMTALLYSVRHATTKKQFLLLAGITALTFTVRFYGYTGKPVSDIFLGLAVGLILFALMALEHLFIKKKDRLWFSFVFPAAYLLFLLFTEWVKINMPFRLDTYFSCLPVLCQMVSVLGIYSLDFLLAWTASVIVFCLDNKKSGQTIYLGILYVLAICALLIFGIVHWNNQDKIESAKKDTVRVACVTGPYYGTLSDDAYMEMTEDQILNSFRTITEEAADQQVEILLYSEEAYAFRDTFEDTLVEEAEETAKKYNMHIILACDVADTDNSENGKSINKLLWISSDGEVLHEYVKHCLVPIVEAPLYVQGEKEIESFDVNVHGKSITVAAAICYDADFDFFMSHMGKKLDLVLLPTWDWKVIAEEHFSVACLRAIASETTLVRSVYDGWDAVINSTGEVLSRANTNDIGYENLWVTDVPIL